MTEPANIWIDFMAANRAHAAYDEPPETDTQHSRSHYRRADVPRPEDAARIAALEEANARLRAGPKVKPLVWRERTDIPGLHSAESPIGWCYNIRELEDGRFEYEGNPAKGWHPSYHGSLVAAQAAGQADYEAFIRPALEAPE